VCKIRNASIHGSRGLMFSYCQLKHQTLLVSYYMIDLNPYAYLKLSYPQVGMRVVSHDPLKVVIGTKLILNDKDHIICDKEEYFIRYEDFN